MTKCKICGTETDMPFHTCSVPVDIASLRDELAAAELRAQYATERLREEEARRAAAEADAAADKSRLDWLESSLCYAMVYRAGCTGMSVLPSLDGNGWSSGRLRAAIDAARTATAQTPKP